MKRLSILSLAAAVWVALGAAGAMANPNSPGAPSTGHAAPTPKATDEVAARTAKPAKLGAFEKNFFTQAAQAGLLEVEASKLAQERATNADVKSFAKMMVTDHTGAADELKQLAASEGVTLPTQLNARQKAILDKLQKAQGAEFDRLYAQTVGLAAHQEAVGLFDKTAKGAKDPGVKAFAEKTLPTLKNHLAQARQLQQAVVSAEGPRTVGKNSSTSPTRTGGDAMTTGTTPAGASTSSNTGVTSSGTATLPTPPSTPSNPK
jgi:putative membrane protein